MIAVLFPTRGRSNRLYKSLNSLYLKAKLKKQIEYLFWVDDDDKKTIKTCRKLKKEFPNVRLFICPRVGFCNNWFVFDQLIKASDREIYLPWADDCLMARKHWDKIMLKYSDDAVVIGHNTRFGFTKKLLENHDIINIYKADQQFSNENIVGYARKHNVYKDIGRGFFKQIKPRKISRYVNDLKNLDNFNVLDCEEK